MLSTKESFKAMGLGILAGLLNALPSAPNGNQRSG